MLRWLVLLLWLPSLGMAANADTLKAFVSETRSAKARFAQMVLDRNGKVLQQVTGTMEFSRPGKFRWEYQKPYEQLIVGDGSRIWIYDKDLKQVTVRKLDRALGASPAALLAGSNEIEKGYALSDAGSHDGLDWLEAVPKAKDTPFERIRLGFKKNTLEAMDMKDQFGQTTVIKFADLERNPRLAPDLFTFV
ncbi:MAG TPA: outer membrane lipoprotein chaperone LolA, partial [Burkholderiales bacterium]|nr:outer membrane lipoprotein chaperone LolA [Burkholderiales bacterium]